MPAQGATGQLHHKGSNPNYYHGVSREEHWLDPVQLGEEEPLLGPPTCIKPEGQESIEFTCLKNVSWPALGKPNSLPWQPERSFLGLTFCRAGPGEAED